MSHPGNSQPLCNYHTLSLGFCCPCLLKAYILDPWARVSGKLKLLLSLEVVYKRVWVSVKFTIIVPSRDHIQAAKCCHLLEQEDLCCCLFSQPCPTLCDPTDSSLPGSSVHGILQARMLELFAISSSRGSSRPRSWTRVSCVSCMAGRFFTAEPPRAAIL